MHPRSNSVCSWDHVGASDPRTTADAGLNLRVASGNVQIGPSSQGFGVKVDLDTQHAMHKAGRRDIRSTGDHCIRFEASPTSHVVDECASKSNDSTVAFLEARLLL